MRGKCETGEYTAVTADSVPASSRSPSVLLAAAAAALQVVLGASACRLDGCCSVAPPRMKQRL